jgi:hypothetical protein
LIRLMSLRLSRRTLQVLPTWSSTILLQHFLLALFIYLTSGTELLAITPCVFPLFSDRNRCGLHEPPLLNGWICDPDNTISLSEVFILDKTLHKNIYSQNEHKCLCTPLNALGKQNPCWYRFGFAFLKELAPVNDAVTDMHTSEKCTYNASLTHYFKEEDELTPEKTLLYAQNYARVVRERWNFGECGEDILFLIVQKPPSNLLPARISPNSFATPMIFASYGSLVMEHIGLMTTFTDSFALQPLTEIVDEGNTNVLSGHPLNEVLNSVIQQTADVLSKTNKEDIPPPSKSHIPKWAWLIFGICVIAFLLMFIGLCLIRTSSRRGTQRSKSSHTDGARRWKAGFVGEENTQPVTYVNLVQMMMPQRQPPTNMMQAV